MFQHRPKRMVDPAAWSAVLLLALAMVLTLAFTERATIARSLRPMNKFSTLAPTAVDPRLSGTFEASRMPWSDPFVRTTVGDLRSMLSDMADQSRRGYPAFLGPCPCPVREQTELLATK